MMSSFYVPPNVTAIEVVGTNEQIFRIRTKAVDPYIIKSNTHNLMSSLRYKLLGSVG